MSQERADLSAGVSRRTILKLTGAGLASVSLPFSAAAFEEGPTSHGLSSFGDLKYRPGFNHFDYVVPEAPKGGRISFTAPSWVYNQNPQTFNSFNTFILKGDAPPRMEICFDTLMVRALDEPDAMYGLIAESVEALNDGNTYVFNLRPEARFHDESLVTAEDVAFSLMLLKADGHPLISQTLTEVEDVEIEGTHRVAVHFTGKQTRQLPLIIADLPILSKAYYTKYDFKQSTLTPPLQSGPYRVGKHALGRFVEYARVEDYWARDLPVMRGKNNFDVIRIEFYRERQTAFEAFKKGDMTFQEEFSSKTWATGYDFPALAEGKVVRKEFPDNRPSGAQGWYFNTRRKKFSDPRIRQAIGYAFDFEWSNKALFFGLYQRTQSFFENSALMAKGKPGPKELELLEPYRDRLPPEVFQEALVPPVSDGSGDDRKLLRKAGILLREAGCKLDGTKLLTPDGEPFVIEFLTNTKAFERITLPYIRNLEKLGIEATFRLVDPAQYQSRVADFDFDITSQRLSLSATLSDSIRQVWGSKAAKIKGSHNVAGISDPIVDALMDKALAAKTREDMYIGAWALDRVLRSGHYWVPQWSKGVHTVAIWDVFGYPDEPPFYDFPVETTWWYDLEKAKQLGMAE
ncbi:MAG: ABC transporter substrate-binding protein [Rhodobacteraceae bacterium]|nr:ABC transporter substrate-binding protein [Paracoccaceae bacterium]